MSDKVVTLCDTIIHFVQGFEAAVQLGRIARASPEEIAELLIYLQNLKEDVVVAVDAVQEKLTKGGNLS